jgi:hypothetical protein
MRIAVKLVAENDVTRSPSPPPATTNSPSSTVVVDEEGKGDNEQIHTIMLCVHTHAPDKFVSNASDVRPPDVSERVDDEQLTSTDIPPATSLPSPSRVVVEERAAIAPLDMHSWLTQLEQHMLHAPDDLVSHPSAVLRLITSVQQRLINMQRKIVDL